MPGSPVVVGNTRTTWKMSHNSPLWQEGARGGSNPSRTHPLTQPLRGGGRSFGDRFHVITTPRRPPSGERLSDFPPTLIAQERDDQFKTQSCRVALLAKRRCARYACGSEFVRRHAVAPANTTWRVFSPCRCGRAVEDTRVARSLASPRAMAGHAVHDLAEPSCII